MASRSSYIEQLSRISLFAACNDRELTKIAKAADEVRVEAGTEVIKQGQIGHECYVIVEGTAEVSREGSTLATLGPGDPFGELAILDGGPRTATVTATTDLDLLVLGQREFSGLLDEVPGLSHKILGALAMRIRELDRELFS